MSNYLGYRLKIGSTVLNDTLVAKGSYKFENGKRVSGSWTDINGVYHEDVLQNRKARISFEIRERNLAEQESIAAIFQTREQISCQYWDDYTCDYKTGVFVMATPSINHLTIEPNGILYAATQIALEEY